MATVTGSSGLLRVEGSWSELTAMVRRKALALQFTEDDYGYTVFAIDYPIYYATTFIKGAIPNGISIDQKQNDDERADFEANYKPLANQPLGWTPKAPNWQRRFGTVTLNGAAEVLVGAHAYAPPASQGPRSIVCMSADDADASGKGAQVVRITFLDSGWFLRTEDVALTGTDPVTTAYPDIAFIESIQVIKGNAAAGTISLMSAPGGGGSQIAVVPAGAMSTLLCHHYVPAGRRAYMVGWGGAADAVATLQLYTQDRPNGTDLVKLLDDVQSLGATRPAFDASLEVPITCPEKSYVWITALPGQAAPTVARAYLHFWEEDYR